MFGRLTALALSAAALAFAPAAFAAQTLEVVSGPAATRAVTVSSFAPIGQSFTAFTDTLSSVGFQFTSLNNTANTPLTLQLFSGETLSGTSLFSTTFTLPGSITSRATVEWIDFALPDLALTAGNLYSFVLTATSTRAALVTGPDFNVNTGAFGGGDAYAGGKLLTNAPFIYANCQGAANNCDLNFRVTGEDVAAAVPEPGTWMTMILGFGLAGAAIRRSHRRGLSLGTVA